MYFLKMDKEVPELFYANAQIKRAFLTNHIAVEILQFVTVKVQTLTL